MHRKQPGEVEARIPGARDRMTNAERAATPLSESVDERGVLFAARRERFPEPDYFEKPDGDRDLPPLPEHIAAVLDKPVKPLVIPLGVARKNRHNHPELGGEDAATILGEAIYGPTKLLVESATERPNNWVFIREDGRNKLAVVDLEETQDAYVVKSWRYARPKDVARMEKKSRQEGGQILITDTRPAAADLPDFEDGSSTTDYTPKAPEKPDETRFATRKITPEEDAAYLDAVERGDTETAQRMVDEAAKRAGYTVEAWHAMLAKPLLSQQP